MESEKEDGPPAAADGDDALVLTLLAATALGEEHCWWPKALVTVLGDEHCCTT